jgi:DNA-binding MarR family transcriptional regulator
MLYSLVMKIPAHDLETIEAALGNLHRAMYQHRAWEELRRSAGLTIDRANATLLKTVAHCPGGQCRMQDVARILGIEAPSVSRTVQELEQAKLLERIQDTDDRRAFNLKLTAAGKTELHKLRAARREHLSEVFASWSAQDRHDFARLLSKFGADLTGSYAEETKHDA